ncbi:MAG: ParB/RepB/Spo0J family partition protein [Flexilinea flocculi]|nr:ParB/RepB/Spo0J family partition protein [Flexilinea flocculi]
MNAQRRAGLGRGLGALLPSSEPSVSQEAANMVPVSAIASNPHQPRTDFKNEELEELADSIREHGIIQPLIVTQEAEGNYTLIAGERRLKAAQMAGLSMVPVIIRQATDRELLELALIENVQREDLSPLETAEAYKNLEENFELTHEEISRRVGKNRVSITNTLRLLKLPESVRSALANRSITEGHARALLALPSEQAQYSVLQMIIKQNLNVRQTEEIVRKLSGEKAKEKRNDKPVIAELKEIEDRLMQLMGTKVTVHPGKKGGSITIYYYSNDDLEDLVTRFSR